MKLYYNGEEYSINFKRRTGLLKEQMRKLRDEFLKKQEFLNIIRDYSIEKGLLELSVTEQVKLAFDDKVITKEMFKDFVYIK